MLATIGKAPANVKTKVDFRNDFLIIQRIMYKFANYSVIVASLIQNLLKKHKFMNHSHANTSAKEVADYYDRYKEHQKKLGINVRHRAIFKNCRRAGLKTDSHVLEIGCGIGTVSHLILNHIRGGSFVGVDISSESVGMARSNNRAFNNARFMVSDMSDFSIKDKFNFVVFPDVLEHIPREQHAAIFKIVSQHCTDDATIVINIPEPNFLDWIRKNDASKLQIIDQSLSPLQLINQWNENNFKIYSVVPYSLNYNVNDYLSLVFKKKMEVEDVKVKSFIMRGIQNTISKLT
jgi:trans-aconitate 2-methyltransferase